jgi:ubiquinone/menaquinone biosynthesis C-methylase UbiE
MRRPLRKDYEYNEFVKDFYRKIEDYDWNDVTDHFRGLETFLHKAREKQMIDLVKKYGQGQKYIDIGCGTGLILRHLPEGSTGIDINPRHLERAKKYVPSAELLLGDAEEIPLPDESFTTAVCTEVLEHLVEPQKALSEISRILQSGGICIGSTPGHSLVWRLRFLSSTHYHNEPFHNEFTRPELVRLFSSWKILSLRSHHLGANFFFALQKK